MEEGKGQGGLATSHQYGNALLGVCYQEEEITIHDRNTRSKNNLPCTWSEFGKKSCSI